MDLRAFGRHCAVMLSGFALMAPLAQTAQAAPLVPTPAEQQQLAAMKQPESWFIANLKGPRETSEGATLDARLQYVLETVTRPSSAPQIKTALRAAYATPTGLAAVRTRLDRYWALHTKVTPAVKLTELVISTKGLPGIKARLLIPEGAPKNLPLIIYYHGGGFMFGGLDGFEPTAQLLANEAKAAVLLIDYRLAPEAPYPAAWSDAEATLDWARKNGAKYGFDSRKIALAGDSAGATLVTAIALRAQKAKKPAPKALLLYYPGVDRMNTYPSMQTFGTGYGLDADNLDYLAQQVYPAGATTTSEDTSPMQAELKSLPPTFVVTAGFDPLRDGQRAFAEKLKASGVMTQTFHYPTLIHAFLQTSAYVPDADTAATETARAFGDQLRAK